MQSSSIRDEGQVDIVFDRSSRAKYIVITQQKNDTVSSTYNIITGLTKNNKVSSPSLDRK